MSKECKACGFPSGDNAHECEFCGERFEDSAPCGEPKITLVNILSNSIVEIPEGGGLIGRGCEIAPEIFNHQWVSEPHCRVLLRDHECYIEDIGSQGIGSTNGTFLDGIKLAPRIQTKFHDGSRIRVAHLIFDAKVEYPTAHMKADVCTDSVEERRIWVIECPVSGRRYKVADASARISECECCSDSVDRKNIAKVKPKQVKAE